MCMYLFNKSRHSNVYMLRIAGQPAGPIGLKFLCGHKWVAARCYRLKNSKYFILKFFSICFPQATPGHSASI